MQVTENGDIDCGLPIEIDESNTGLGIHFQQSIQSQDWIGLGVKCYLSYSIKQPNTNSFCFPLRGFCQTNHGHTSWTNENLIWFF